jgi:hypothetical protein
MELHNLPESVAALIEASDIIECGSEKHLLAAVKEAGYWLDNVEYPDINSGSVPGLSTYRERQEFAQRWADVIDTVVAEDYLNLEGIESLDDAYARYCQAAVSWAYGHLESTLEYAADISPEMIEELIERVQTARELDDDEVWDDTGVDILPSEDLEELGFERVEKADIIGIWLKDVSAEVWEVRDSLGAAAGMLLCSDDRALWFPDASHRHA